MQKKISFLPALHPRDDGFQHMSGLAIGDTYVNYRERLKLCVPDRAFEKEDPMSSWKLGNRNGSFFKKDVRQELDDYDVDFRKYMTTWERGIDNPKKLRKGSLNASTIEKTNMSPMTTKQGKNLTLEPIVGITKSSFRTLDQSSPQTVKESAKKILKPSMLKNTFEKRNNSVQPNRQNYNQSGSFTMN